MVARGGNGHGLEVDVRLRRDGFAVEASFEVPPGHRLALLGPNGAGKTTLVHALAGLIPVDDGRVSLGQQVLEDTSKKISVPPSSRSVGMVFQDLRLFPHLTSLENVAFPLRARGARRSGATREAASLLARMGLSSVSDRPPEQLSGGEAQAVALARAMIHRPALLLLDEPLSALDVEVRGRTRAIVRDALEPYEGATIVVTHDPVDAMVLGHELAIMEYGRIVQRGTPDEISTVPRTRYAAELAGLNLLVGHLVRDANGATLLETAEGAVIVANPDDPVARAARVLGILKPSDVVLSVDPPSGSARNVLRGRVSTVTTVGDRARVRLLTKPPLVAEITRASAERLDIREGHSIWAAFKAVEVQLLPG